MNRLSELHEAVSAVCRIDGVSSDGRIDFQPAATQQERAAARAVVDTWDWNAMPDADKSSLDALLDKDPSVWSNQELRQLLFLIAKRIRKGIN